MREAAEDAVQSAVSRRERASSLSIQRFTILAGVALAPLIIGIVCGAASALGSGAGAEEAAGFYVFAFSAFAALFLSVQEGEPRRASAYAPVFCAASLSVFLLSRAWAAGG
jgi:hypothetical protein